MSNNIGYRPVSWVTAAKIEEEDAGINLIVVIHKADPNQPTDKADAYEISGPATLELLTSTQLCRLVIRHENGRNAEVFLLPVDTPFTVKCSKIKGKRSGKRAIQITVTFVKGCKEGYDEFIITVPYDFDDGASGSRMAEALEKAANRVKKALYTLDWDARQAELANNTSTRSDVSDAMVVDQIGSPPGLLLSPIPVVKTPTATPFPLLDPPKKPVKPWL